MKTQKPFHWLVALGFAIVLMALSPVSQNASLSTVQPGPRDFGPASASTPVSAGHPLTNRKGPETPPLLPEKQATLSTSKDWRAYPVYGGEMTSIAIAADPTITQTIYVGTRDAGIFKTTDGGQSWQPARTGLTFYPIRSLKVDPQNADILYAGTDYNGIWKSTDAGQTWYKSSNGLYEGLIVFNITIDPQNPNTLYAGLAGGIGFVIGNIYKSEDGGATWVLKDNGIPRYSETYTNGIFSLAIDPDNPSILYAGANFDGAFKSTDGGETWTAINKGLPFMPNTEWYQKVSALAVDHHHANRVSVIIGGEYYVFDETGGWELVSEEHTYLGDARLYFHPTDPGVIYAPSSFSGFSKSTDGGVSWDHFGVGIFDVAFQSVLPDVIYGAHGGNSEHVGGVFKSSDQGETWSGALQGITALAVQSVAIDPQDARNIYAGTGGIGGGHLFRTQDGGATWDLGYYYVWYADPDNYQLSYYFGAITDIAVDPFNSQIIYLAARSGFFKSTDQGQVFDKIDQFPTTPICIAASPHISGTLYVGTGSGHGVYKSIDGGATWSPKTDGLPIFGSNICPILSIATDPGDANTVWAGTQSGGGIVKSTDGGEHWQTVGLTETNFVEAIAVNPINSDEILVGGGFWDGSIYKSTDGGVSWQAKIEDIAFVKDIVYDPQNPRWVYAATEGAGVLRSFDSGENWHDYSAGIFYPVLHSLAISQDNPPLLVAGTYGTGLYWISLPKNIYIEPNGLCGSNSPCYSSIQDGINAADSGDTIKIAQGTYPENILMTEAKALTLQPGWDPSFTSRGEASFILGNTGSAHTTVKGTITIGNGAVIIQ